MDAWKETGDYRVDCTQDAGPDPRVLCKRSCRDVERMSRILWVGTFSFWGTRVRNMTFASHPELAKAGHPGKHPWHCRFPAW